MVWNGSWVWWLVWCRVGGVGMMWKRCLIWCHLQGGGGRYGVEKESNGRLVWCRIGVSYGVKLVSDLVPKNVS